MYKNDLLAALYPDPAFGHRESSRKQPNITLPEPPLPCLISKSSRSIGSSSRCHSVRRKGLAVVLSWTNWDLTTSQVTLFADLAQTEKWRLNKCELFMTACWDFSACNCLCLL
ncbi:hypothetical protein COLO4_25906 [Corchorus olitorius]|uniref:Uncharacterized protein n=1 Tax=Corchorus olitorius TaxID=93759 RepID=A0A1R3HZJ2_9ROSI|nr:hypothetical protein COLO4_25906 [Corchorus olitorius]